MEKVIFQIKYNDKMYNKFILLAKEVNKEGKDIYKKKNLLLTKIYIFNITIDFLLREILIILWQKLIFKKFLILWRMLKL